MAFEQTGVGAATEGASAILGLQQKMQDTMVRPRELEAATSIAESKASILKSQVGTMQRMALADSNAAQAVKDANASGDNIKTLQLRMKAYSDGGMLEQANDIQKEIEQAKQSASDSVTKAAKAQQETNELKASSIRSLGSWEETTAMSDQNYQDAFAKAQQDPTPENRQAAAQAAAQKQQVDQAKQSGIPFEQFHAEKLVPYADNLSTQAQHAKLVAAENKRAHDQLLEDQKNKDRESRERIAAQRLAVDREKMATEREKVKATISKGTDKSEVDIAKLEQNYTKEMGTLQRQKASMEKEMTDPDSPWYNKRKMANPDYAEVIDLMDKARTQLDESKAAIRAKAGTPTTKTTSTEKVTFSPTQETWISKALEHNPGMSREDVIAQGKKLKKL